MLVPGTFGCSNLSYFPLEQQAKNNVEKLDGYFKWAKQDKRIAGFNPWHYNTRAEARPATAHTSLLPMPPRNFPLNRKEASQRVFGN